MKSEKIVCFQVININYIAKLKEIHELIIKPFTLCPDVIIVYTNSIKKIFVMIVAKAAHFYVRYEKIS